MIATWMLYSAAVAAVFGVCALALEHGARRLGMPVRWLWAGALLASLVLSALPWARSAGEPSAERAAGWIGGDLVRVGPVEMPTFAPAAELDASPRPGVRSRLEMLDRPLLALWAAATGLGMLYLLGTHRTLARRRRFWRRTVVEGVPALLSRDVGPAVVGFLDSAIVVPAWVTELEPEQRRLVLAHEEEHLLAGDARLLSLALVAVAVAPWNAALWWQMRRLRHAVELDCDARVLDGDADAERYCDLLIEVGARASMRGIAFAAFAESSSFLERRIMSMVGPRPRRWTLAAGLCVTLAGFLTLYACEAPIPTLPAVGEEEAEVPELIEFREIPDAVEVDTTFVWTGDATLEPGLREDTVVPGSGASAIMSAEGVTALVRRRHPELFMDALPLERAVWLTVRDGRVTDSWIGPNLYINFHEGRSTVTLAEREADLARRQAEALAEVRAREPGMEVRGISAAHYYAGTPGRPTPFTVHFFTDRADAPGEGGQLGQASGVVDDAIAAELER